jgi:hypothetical protein
VVKTTENGGGKREARGCEWTKAGDAQAAAAAAAAAEQQAFPIVLLSFDWGYVSQEPKARSARQMLHTDKRRVQQQEQEQSGERHLF